MNKNTKIALTIFAIFILLLVGLYFYNKDKGYKYRWTENYQYDNDQPYGLNIAYTLLGSYFPNHDVVLNDKEPIESFIRATDTSGLATYVVMGGGVNYSASDELALKNFTKRGNTVFMALSELPYELLAKLNRRCEYEYLEYFYGRGKHISATFTNPGLKQNKSYRFFYEYNNIREQRYWMHFNDFLCDSLLDYEVLGQIQSNHANFIRIPYGEGEFLIHTNPLFFSNLHIIRPEAAEYVSKVFSHFPEGPIYWDKYSKLWVFRPRSDSNVDQTPFTYILKQRGFKWAYYTIWVLVIFFALFNLWRKQRPIPVKFFNQNTSLEFMKTIGELYFSAKNNRKLAIQKMDHFLKWARMKYYISERQEEAFILKLSKKSEVSIKEIQAIFKQYNRIKNGSDDLSDSFLIGFYQSIEQLKKKSK